MKSSKKDMSFGEKVEADNRVKAKDAEERAKKYRTDAMTEKGMKKGGSVKKKPMRAMQTIAAKAVKGHEKRMHGKKMSGGGSCRGGGAATKGKGFQGVM